MKPLLLLDLGGVLLNDPMSEFFLDLADGEEAKKEEIEIYYRKHLRDKLWRGDISETHFWQALLTIAARSEGKDVWQEYLLGKIRPLPTCKRVPELAQKYRLGAVSNHRARWCLPILKREEIFNYFDNIFVSDKTKQVKPEAGAVLYAANKMGVDLKETIFVDDQEKNLEPLREYGVKVILADKAGKWVDQLLS